MRVTTVTVRDLGIGSKRPCATASAVQNSGLMAGAESKEHEGKDANTPIPLRGESMEKPVGEWNKAETICIHNQVESFINGKFVNEVTECTLNDGFIGIQSEGGEIEIRAIYYSPLKY